MPPPEPPYPAGLTPPEPPPPAATIRMSSTAFERVDNNPDFVAI